MKNIVICSDGTGNTAIKGRGTNVFKLFEALDVVGHNRRTPDGVLPIQQIAFYDDGVGSEGFTLIKILGGMAGWGLSRNVKELYTELARVYEPGDKLFLFGFSRGAFTVRTLCGLIAKCGIVDVSHPDLHTKADLDRTVKSIYKEYRKRYRTYFGKLLRGDGSDEALAVATKYRVYDSQYAPGGRIPVEFLGVWDTVDAVGLPLHISDIINEVIWRFKFSDFTLNDRVQHACHALCIDDERHSFEPVLWSEKAETPGRIEQVWFAGVHSNVGGGYPRQGMSLVALDWIMSKAEEHSLRFLPEVRELYHELQNVDDRLYDPRAGLAIFYRWKPRDIAALCRKRDMRPKIHISAIERIARATEGYAPCNIPPNAEIIETARRGKEWVQMGAGELAQVRQALLKAHSIRTGRAELPLLDDLSVALKIGFASYYVFLAAVLWAIAVAGGYIADHWDEGALLGVIWGAVTEVVSDWRVWAGFVTAYLLAFFTNARFDATCSEFWHKAQRDLKTALGIVSAQAKAPRVP